MRRFFTDQPLSENSQIQLCEQSYHHWIRVLRAKVGNAAVLFNGHGGEYVAELLDITKKTATVQLGTFNPINRDNPYQTTIAIVMSKGDRMDYALQKSTEMGVSHIQLLTSTHCEVKLTGERLEKKLKNWRGVIVSACEQSGLNVLPTLHTPLPVSTFVTKAHHDIKCVLAPTATGKPNMPFPQTLPKSLCFLIGAEGGLTAEEVALAKTQMFEPWCLGQRILRTETAPVAALSMLHSWYCK